MQFENSFEVQAPPEEVYDAMLDLERVAPCMPGAKVLEQTGDYAYKVSIKVKVGPMTMTYRGEVEVIEKDSANRSAVMAAKAKEARGQGIAEAKVHMSLTGDGATTHGKLDTDVQLSGKAAAMGQGVIQDVSATLVATFADNLAAMLSEGRPEGAAATAAPPTVVSSTLEPAAEEPAVAQPAAEEPAVAAAPGPTPPEPVVAEIPEPVTPEPVTPEPIAPGPTAPEPVTTEFAAAEPIAPEPIAPEPAGPEPITRPTSAARGPAGPPPAQEEASLPLGAIAASVAKGRLRDPKVVVAIGGLALLVLLARRR